MKRKEHRANHNEEMKSIFAGKQVQLVRALPLTHVKDALHGGKDFRHGEETQSAKCRLRLTNHARHFRRRIVHSAFHRTFTNN
jgi:hypothetical protein